MHKCWAETLGNCSDKISGEHIVTAGLFDGMVSVQGLSWCKDEPKTIGLNSATRKILCTKHNNILSLVDEAAIAGFKVFRESVRLTDARTVLKERLWSIVRLRLDGDMLERWFLKTLINVNVGGSAKIGPKSNTPGKPSADLVEVAYGLRKFNPNAGLHVSAEAGETIDSEDRVTVIPFFGEKNEYLLGGTFYFRGFRFMLNLLETGFTDTITFNHGNGSVTRYSKPLRHLKHVKVSIGPSNKYISHVIDFDWDKEQR